MAARVGETGLVFKIFLSPVVLRHLLFGELMGFVGHGLEKRQFLIHGR